MLKADPMRAAIILNSDNSEFTILSQSKTTTNKGSIVMWALAPPLILRREDLGQLVTGEFWVTMSGAVTVLTGFEIVYTDDDPLEDD